MTKVDLAKKLCKTKKTSHPGGCGKAFEYGYRRTWGNFKGWRIDYAAEFWNFFGEKACSEKRPQSQDR